MQKTSNSAVSGFFDPINFSKDFPITRPCFKIPPTLAHVHNCFEIGLCRAGAGIFIVEDKVFSCLPGDVIFINNREFHALKNASPFNSDWKFINLDPAALLAGWIPPEENALDISRLSGRAFTNVVREKEHPDIVFIVRKLVDELEKKEKAYRSLVRSLVWTLLIMLQRLVPEKNREEEKKPAEIQRIYPALQYLSTHYSESLDISRLADMCHCSLSTFRRTFQRGLGCLPLDYVNDFRLKVATTMLSATDQSILEIATEAGFSTQSNFNRLFKAKFKQSPRDYRKNRSICGIL
ncbi:MAG: hypothetical protein A2020_16315 [Lentisphaerae bacterium GWF2_45_14]|nr:MAG: hypothetical protein A2020_16315 [Lentisphaerae bacterium GWF2_45_14]